MRLIRGLLALAMLSGVVWAAWWLAWQVGAGGPEAVPPPPGLM
jgi:hypothetical protein